MKVFILPAFLFILFAASLASTPVLAASPDALPPPTHSNPPSADTADNGTGNQTQLNKELAPPPEKNKVKVLSSRRPDGAIITKYSVHGRVFMIKVQPANGMPAYYLYDTNGDGNFNRRLPGNYRMLSPPMWVLKRF